mgnify:CR=1 FL=1
MHVTCDEVACLHVERNMLVGLSYLDIEDNHKHILYKDKTNNYAKMPHWRVNQRTK